jgi:restriction endonuclease S subunit
VSFKDSGVIPLARVRDIRGSTFKTYLDHQPDSRFVIENGNLVIGMDGDFNCIQWMRGAAALNQRLCMLKSTDVTRLRFIGYALPRALKHLNELMPAATVKHLSSSEILKTHVPMPGAEEQGLIVRYLDHAELRIAKAIAAKQGVVRLLREQKAVVESRALFGGGWSTGVEKWFGEVPAGWDVLPSRALFAERIERNRGDLEMLSVTMARGVVRQSSYLKSDGSKKDQAREDRSQYKAVEPDDLVYNKMRAWQGAAGKSEFRGIVSPAYVVLRPLSGANSDYYGMMLRSRQFAREAERHSYGITSDMWSLRPQHFKLIEFPRPPLTEQAAIVNLCKAQTEKIDAAIEAIEAEITLLKEYRSRLISDVVTGKLDVRDEAAKIPEIDPMELATVSIGENGDDEEETDDD